MAAPTAIAPSRDFVNLRILRFSRNQREAGIDHLQWEDRIKPMRPLTYDIGVGVSAASSLLLALVLI